MKSLRLLLAASLFLSPIALRPTQAEPLGEKVSAIGADWIIGSWVDAPTAGAQSLVSLWQNNLLGIRAERYINWAARRPGKLGIALITGVNY